MIKEKGIFQMKTLIIYYSQTKKTATVAETLALELGADSIEIVDNKPRSGFKNRLTSSFDAVREIKTDITPMRVDVSDYDIVYFGTPVWAGKPTPAILTIIDRCDLRAKDVVLFATMNSSGGAASVERMAEKVKLRGARVIETFTLKTKGKDMKQLMNETETIIEILDLNMYR